MLISNFEKGSVSTFIKALLYNLLNKLYYDGAYYTSPSENHVNPGAGRSVTLTVHWKS